MAHLNRRLLGLDFKATIILPEPVIRVPQAHQIVQLLHGRVSVAVVIIDPNGLRGHLGLAGDHIRQEEKAHHIGRLCPPHILQRFLRDIAGIQEAAAAGAAGNAGKNVHVQIGAIHSIQCLPAFGLDCIFQRTRLGDQQVTAHLADAAGPLGAQQTINVINIHPVQAGVALNQVFRPQGCCQIWVIDGEKLPSFVQLGLAAHPVDIGGVRIDGQELDVLIFRYRRIGVVRLQLQIYLLLQFRQCRHAGAADADGQCRRTAVLLGLLAAVDDTASAVQ